MKSSVALAAGAALPAPARAEAPATPFTVAATYAYTVGLDMARRDLQRAMGDEKKRWEIGKSFDVDGLPDISVRVV